MSYIFISYSHQDSNYAHRLPPAFEKMGFECWLDEDLEYGDEWFRKIEEAIKKCAAIIVVMTPEAEQSKWVQKEIHLGFKYDKPIYPIRLRGDDFAILVDIQSHVPQKDWDYLPSPRFYRTLATVVPRKSQLTEELAARLERERQHRVNSLESSDVNPNTYKEITRWSKLAKGSDYYSILRYAIALENEKSMHSHFEAVQQLKKAFTLERRILNRSWLSAQYEWNDTLEANLQNLANDPDFQSYKKSHG